ncbi:MAG: cytochrome o ubiquinol oxidase subunit IV [Verrucomicrobia bacterium]|nr:cytochrome o ubiquinol oxidase subunit IV [Verrucomicrobiota bacterium]MBS0646650.1 cytochrome o ubiquinol oxidase subunit IV [Verrucomicrobiota bacterium]
MHDPAHPETFHGNFKEYITGFLLSLLLTFTAYFLVVEKLLVGWKLYSALALLGGIQAVVQLFLFLHLGKDVKPQWKLLIFCFMLMVLSIIVAGSLWIMYSLNERMMPAM